MSIIVRELRKEDSAAASQVHYDAFKSYLKERMPISAPIEPDEFFRTYVNHGGPGKEIQTFVAEEDGKIIGMIKADADLTEKIGGLCQIGVQPGLGSRGVGTLLFRRAFAWWKTLGMIQILTSVSSINPGALKFYLKQGFRIDHVEKGVYFEGVDETFLKKDVNL